MGWRDKFRKPKKDLDVKSRQPENLVLAIEKYKDRPGAAVRYLHKLDATEAAISVAQVDIADHTEIIGNIEGFLESKFGGRHWEAHVVDQHKSILARYKLTVGGPMYSPNRKRKLSPDEAEDVPKARRGAQSDIMEMMRIQQEANTTLITALLADRRDPVEAVSAIITAFGGLNQPSEFEGMAKDIFTVFVNNSLEEKEGIVGKFRELAELQAIMQPKLEQGDMLQTLVGLAPSLLQTIAMIKSGGPGAPATAMPVALPQSVVSAGNGGLNVATLAAIAQSIPNEYLATLPADQQAEIMKLKQAAAAPGTAGAVLARPGGVVAPSAPAGPVPAAPVGSQLAQRQAIDGMILEIRQDLAARAPDDHVAKKMIGMVTYARSYGVSHPLIDGVISATDDNGRVEFGKLCDAMPELAGDNAHIQALADTVLRLISEGASENLQIIEDGQEGPVTDVLSDVSRDAPTGDGPELEFQFETEEERQKYLEGVQDDGTNVPRPAGIPDETEEGSAVGSGTDRANIEQVRQSA